MAEILRGGVIGAGVFGGYHAGQYAKAAGAIFACVLDPDPVAGAALVARHGGQHVADLDQFLSLVDVVTVASPAIYHAAGTLAALRAGKPVYVEKPLAISLEEADQMIGEASRRNLVLACGHQERVVSEVIGLLAIPERPLRMTATRHGPPSERSLDVSVVLDLMIHDLDLAIALTSALPFAVEAQGQVAYSGGWDQVSAEVTFDDGFTAQFDASRMAQGRHRTVSLTYPSGEVEIDFITRQFRNTTPYGLNANYADDPAFKDPLGVSVAGFLAAVRGQAPRPVVTASEAARALDLALAVERALTE